MSGPIDVRDRMTLGRSGRYELDPRRVRAIAIHHSVSGPQWTAPPDETQDDEIAHLQAIDRAHVAKGYGGFGYHLAAFVSGRWYYCGDLGGARAHVASLNSELIGVVLIGDFSGRGATGSLLIAAGAAVRFARSAYPGRPINGHGALALPQFPTSCPGMVAQQLTEIDRYAKEDDMAVQIRLVRKTGDKGVFLALGGFLQLVPNPEALVACGWTGKQVEDLPAIHPIWKLPKRKGA